MKKYLFSLLIVCLFACETVIYPELDQPAEILVVDAWLIQGQPSQLIKITRSQSYFETAAPSLVHGAQVTVSDLETGDQYAFVDSDSGYVWTAAEAFGTIGNTYQLTIEFEGQTFEATAHLGDVPEIDSLVFRHNPEDFNILESYYSAEFFARDLEGVGNAYWIKTWKNGSFLNKPSEINIALDAGMGSGQDVDGLVFHQAIRKDHINPLEERPDRANYYYPPYDIGDSIYVEIHSIDEAAFDYLTAVKIQTNRPGGFSELFAVPLANVTTNLRNMDPTSNTAIAGFFNVSAVSSASAQLTEELAQQLK